MSYAQPAIAPRSVIAVSLVVLVHALMFYVLHNGLERSALEFVGGPVFAELIDEPQVEPREPPPPPPTFQPVHVDSVPAPEIAIDLPADSGQAITLATAAPKPAAAPSGSAPDITPPRIDRQRSELMPMYPPTSRRLGEEGRVLLLVHVLANGTSDEIKLKQSSGYERLDQAAIAHAQHAWHFVPARSGDRAVDYWGEFALTFRLTTQ
jgi:periplasmic protein TonB